MCVGGACALGAVVVAAHGEEEQGETARFSWARGAGAEACASGAELQAEVNKRLGRDAFAEPARRSIEGVVTREGAKWIARLYVRELDGTLLGQRELTSDAADCKALGSAVVLAVALAIDPEAAMGPPPSTSSSAAPSTSTSGSAAPRPKKTKPVPMPPPMVVFLPMKDPDAGAFVSPRILIATGLVPRPAIGAALGVDPHRLHAIHPTFGAMLVPSTRVSPDGQVGFALTAGWLGVCARLAGDERVLVSTCGSAWLGVIHAFVYSFEPVEPGDRFWAGLSASGRTAIHLLGPLYAEVGFDALLPLTRHHFRVENRVDELFQQPFLALTGWLGAGLRFQ